MSILASREGRVAGDLDHLDEVEKVASAQGPAVPFLRTRSVFA